MDESVDHPLDLPTRDKPLVIEKSFHPLIDVKMIFNNFSVS
jgi:hypothetical protein